MQTLKKNLAYFAATGAVVLSILACGGGDEPDPNEPISSNEFCGGIAGLQCSNPAETCVQPEGMCNVADGGGTCQLLPEACTKQYDPVCGCDGQTYGNACMAKLAGVGIDKAGACKPTTGGQTCGTRGAAQCTKPEVCIWPESSNCGRADKPGTCQKTVGQICPEIYDPVCGCDGQTYSSECEANASGISVDSKGECPKEPGKACGARLGNTCAATEYCKFEPAAICGRADATGVCEPKPAANSCLPVNNLVCGCDDQTYKSACEASVAGVSVLKLGACDSEPQGKACGGIFGVACGNGEFCKYGITDLCGAADAMGRCESIPQICPQVAAPVCGCNDQTYINSCYANSAGVSVSYNGACRKN